MKDIFPVMNREHLFGWIIFLYIVTTYILTVILKPEIVSSLGKEDGIIETCSAICYLLSSLILLYVYFLSKSSTREYLFGTRRNIFLLLFAFYLFMCFGEEISWGQRIFGIKTGEFMNKINMQHENNIHNINIFHSQEANGTDKEGVKVWITAPRIYAMFWLFYCFLIPIINHFFSKFSDFLKK